MNWRRALQIGLALTVLATAVVSAVVSATVIPEMGVDADLPGGLVRDVIPGSPSWRDGIRTGERVLELEASDSPGGWALTTTDGVLSQDTSTVGQIAVLRSHVAWSVAALAFALVAALFAYRGIGFSAALLPVALPLVSQPILFAGSLPLELAAGIVVFLGSGLAVLAFGRRPRLGIAAAALGAGLTGAWFLSILALAPGFDPLDGSRGYAAAAFTGLGLGASFDRRRVVGLLTGGSGPTFLDLVLVAVLVGLALAGFLGVFPWALVAILAVVVVAAYPAGRRWVLASIERLVTDQARRDARIRAVEDERRRVARDIHDAPLQELSGAILRIESLPGGAGEAAALRVVAGQLRELATNLHPSVLQDLGLAAAIVDLGDQLRVNAVGWSVVVEVDDLSDGERQPADVELAAYRIVQEASNNALTHSGGRCLRIGGSVAFEAIDLAVDDDGSGLRDELVQAARRSGHFGLDSMRERADAVGASLEISSSPGMTSVRFSWEAST